MRKGFALPLVLVLATIVIIAIGVIAYFQLKPKLSSQSTAIQASPISIQNNETENWKTYTNKEVGYSIKYPTDFKLYDKWDSLPFLKVRNPPRQSRMLLS